MPNPCNRCGACGDPSCCTCTCNDDDYDEEKTEMRLTDKSNLPRRRRSCSNCGRLGHQTRTCRNPPKAHDKIGVEVEGWWMRERWSEVLDLAVNNWHMGESSDGSLAYDESEETVAHEFKTRPGSLCEAISQTLAIYPDKCDASAGMHVHMSFRNPMDIGLFNSDHFFDFFKARWKAWGERNNIHRSSDFWSRLEGRNSYCQVPYVTPDFGRGGDRYRQINWQAWRGHRTVEFRLLPLFKQARLAALALEETVLIVEDYLAQHANEQLSVCDRECDVEVRAGGYSGELTYTVEYDETRIVNHEIPLEEYWDRNYGWYPASRTVELSPELDPVNIDRAIDIQVPEVVPPTPGHMRFFGRQGRRQVRDLLSNYYVI